MACSARHGYRPGTASVAVIVNTIEVALCQSLPAGGCPMSPLLTIDQKKRWAASLTARTWCRPAGGRAVGWLS
jgi:hypothetical protein